MIEALRRLKDRTTELNYATPTIAAWIAEHLKIAAPPQRILDIGLGSGRDLLAAKSMHPALELHGIESQSHWIDQARARGISVADVNIERERLPFDDGYFDVVLANHVIEHVKEIFWFMGEISRVVKPGGIVIIGCPNLSSWHNRLALAFGYQPPCMKILGPHVRGVTKQGFQEFIERDGYFKLVRWKGSNLYPLPTLANRMVGKIVPNLCASVHFLMRRTTRPGNFLSVLDSKVGGICDTPYFRG